MYYLYRKDKNTDIFEPEKTDFLSGCELKVFYPRLFSLTISPEEAGLKTKLSRLYFYILTKGKYKIYYLCDGVHIVHTAFVIPPCSKFPFMEKGDYEIGPCVTNVKYRKKGAYKYILSQILKNETDNMNSAYMIVSHTNYNSIKGIESVGFSRIGNVSKIGIFKKYRLEM